MALKGKVFLELGVKSGGDIGGGGGGGGWGGGGGGSEPRWVAWVFVPKLF
jgi:hypothetical protein